MSTVKSYTRIVTTDDGGAAFEDAELHLDEMQVSEGVPPMFVGGLGAGDGAMFTSFAAFDSEPHPVPRPTWVIMLRGVMEVRVDDGEPRRFGPGDLVLAADANGRGHVALTVGDAPFEALLVPADA